MIIIGRNDRVVLPSGSVMTYTGKGQWDRTRPSLIKELFQAIISSPIRYQPVKVADRLLTVDCREWYCYSRTTIGEIKPKRTDTNVEIGKG